MSDTEHCQVAEALRECEGKVAISSYRCELMDRLYSDWRRYDAPPQQCHSIKKLRQESLWMNY